MRDPLRVGLAGALGLAFSGCGASAGPAAPTRIGTTADAEEDAPSEPELVISGHVAGIGWDATSALLAAREPDELVRALEAGWRGWDEMEGVATPSGSATVTLREVVTVPGSARRAAILTAQLPSRPNEEAWLAVAVEHAGCWELLAYTVGSATTDAEIEDRESIASVEVGWRGAVLLVDVVRERVRAERSWTSTDDEGECLEAWEETTTSRDWVACVLAADGSQCVVTPAEIVSTPRTIESSCPASAGGSGVEDTREEDPLAPARATIAIREEGIVVEAVDDPDGRLDLSPGLVAWDAPGRLTVLEPIALVTDEDESGGAADH